MVRVMAHERLAMTKHEVAHGSYAQASGLRVESIALTPEAYTEVHYVVDRAGLALCWRLDPCEAIRQTVHAIGTILAPSICDPEGSPWQVGSYDWGLMQQWYCAWQRLSGTEHPPAWSTLDALARKDITHWYRQPGAAEALTWLAERLATAGSLREREWMALWRSTPAQPLWSEIDT